MKRSDSRKIRTDPFTYRMLDGSAEFYVERRTPEALRVTREQLTRKYVELGKIRRGK